MEGLDNDFVNYGIRKDDLSVIEALCQNPNFNLDFEWLKDDVLKEYHNKKSSSNDISDAETEAVLNKALQQI
jgi:hypothetical protein